MAERFLVVLFQVITLFLMMGAGFILGKIKLLDEAGTKQASAIIINVVTPCLVVSSLQIDLNAQLLQTMGKIALASFVCLLVNIAVAALHFRKEPEDDRVTMRFGAVFGNTGFMGIPLVAAVLGQETTLVAVIVIAVCSFLTYTYGVMIMGGKKAFSAKTLASNPVLISIILGLALMFLRIKLPGPVGNAVSTIAGINSPLAMITIGAQLSRADLSGIFSQFRLYRVTVLRNILFPVLEAFILLPLKLDRITYIALVILMGTPTAGVTSILSERYGRNYQLAAQLVSLTTILSAVTLPFIAVLAETLAGN